jgi:hypothetical protein
MKRITLIAIALCTGYHAHVFAQSWTGTTTTENITRTGSVGIGTSTYGAKLNVEGVGDWHLRLKDNQGGGVDWYVGSSGTGWVAGAGKLVFSPTSTSNNALLTLTQSGKVGVGAGNTGPRAIFDVGYGTANALVSSFGRLPEGDGTGEGTYLGTRTFSTGTVDTKSFSIDHGFYGNVNSSISFYRGQDVTGGFMTFSTYNNTERMRIDRNGAVCIGTTDPHNYKLSVNGSIGTKEVNVTAGPWPDYVFDNHHNLLSLPEIEKYIQANQRLPEVPSASEVEKNGVNLGEMNVLLLKKIEELTLYIIDQEKRIKELESRR